MKLNDIFLQIINKLIKNGNSIIIFGFPDLSNNIYTEIKKSHLVKIVNHESITSFSLKNLSQNQKYDYIVLPNIIHKFTNHYTTWKEIANLAENAITIVPDISHIFEKYNEYIDMNIKNNNLCFDTIRMIEEMYGNTSKNLLSYYSNKLNRIFYSNKIFENMDNDFINALFPYMSINSYEYLNTDNNDMNYIKFEGQLHVDPLIENDLLDIYKKYAEYFFNDPSNVYIKINKTTADNNYNIIKVIKKFVNPENVIVDYNFDNVDEITIINLFQNTHIRKIDLLIGNLLNCKENIRFTFQMLNKSFLISQIEKSIDDINIIDFWKFNCDIFKSQNHTDPKIVKLILTQNFKKCNHYKISVDDHDSLFKIKIT